MATKVAAWLQVLGNFGLILGLVLVAVQIKQGSDLARVQMGHDAWLLNSEEQYALMGENPQAVLAKIWLDSEFLTDEELSWRPIASLWLSHFTQCVSHT